MENNKSTDVEVIAEYQDSDVALMESAEKRIKMLERFKTMALKITKPHDWVMNSTPSGPRPYLQATGAEPVARLFGVTWKIDRVERKDDVAPDGTSYYVFEVYGSHTISKTGETIDTYGARSSLDRFYQGQEKEATKDSPAKYIDWRDVKQAAISNFEVNGITRLLGLRNVTAEMLQEAGVDLSQVPGVSYSGKKGGKKEDAPEDTRPKLLALVNQVVGEDDEKRADFLEVITSFANKEGKEIPGVRSFQKLNLDRSRVSLGKLRKAIADGTYKVAFDKEGKALKKEAQVE